MSRTGLLVMTSCSVVHGFPHSGGICCLHLHHRRSVSKTLLTTYKVAQYQCWNFVPKSVLGNSQRLSLCIVLICFSIIHFFLVSLYCRFREQMKSPRVVLYLISELQIEAKSIKQANTHYGLNCVSLNANFCDHLQRYV
jgi:hypothetical protein